MTEPFQSVAGDGDDSAWDLADTDIPMEIPPRACTWTACEEAARADSFYCERHADLVTPERLTAMLHPQLPPERKARAVAAREAAKALSAQRHARRRMERSARAAGRPQKKRRKKK